MNNFLLRFISSLILAPLFIYLIYINNFFFLLFIFIIFLLCAFELKFLINKNISLFLILVFIIIFFLYSFVEIRGSKLVNFFYLLWLIMLVWLTDIGGYFFGKFFGGKKLSKWSPNKTYSGVIGSAISSQLSIFIINFFYYLMDYTLRFAFIQFFFCIIAICGDLYFSYIKRKYLIKDYSKIIPGHGGVLDRIDGLIFVVIIFYLMKYNYGI